MVHSEPIIRDNDFYGFIEVVDRPKLSVVICMVKHDDYMTPFSAWKDVSAYIPRHLTLWEAFYGDGTSGHHLTELGFDVIYEDVDFFEHDSASAW